MFPRTWPLLAPEDESGADAGAADNSPDTGGADEGGSRPPADTDDAGSGGTTDAGGTSADSGGGGDTDVEKSGEPSSSASDAAAFPDKWREEWSGGDAKVLEQLKRIASPADLVRSWTNAQKKISERAEAPQKPEGDDAEALAAWRKDVGLPETPDGYLDALPEGPVIGEDDKDLVGDFVQRMHDADVATPVVHEALKWYYDYEEALATQEVEADREFKKTGEQTLRGEWGADFDGNFTAINGMLDEFGETNEKGENVVANILFGARGPDGRLLGDNPALLRALGAIALQLSPVVTLPGNVDANLGSVSRRMAELEAMMHDTKSDYYVGPNRDALQKEWRDLYDARERMQSRRSA